MNRSLPPPTPPTPPVGPTDPTGWEASEPIDPARIEDNWRAITAELDAPRPSWVERSLRRLRIPSYVTRLIVATPALRRAWFLALALVVIVGLSATNPDDPRGSVFVLLFLAPMTPVLGIAMAYGPAADPAHEAHLATPMRGLRLLAVRSVAVIVVSFVIIVVFSLTNEQARPLAAAWLLPALALSAGSLAAMTFTTPRRATAGVTVLWIVVALIGRAAADDTLGAFAPAAQLLALVVFVVATSIAVARRDRFDRLVIAT